MKPRLPKLNFANKLSILILLTTLSSLSLVAGVLTYIGIKNYQQDLQLALIEKAEIMAYNLVPILSFNDAEGANIALKAFRADSSVNYASVYSNTLFGLSETPLAEYQAKPNLGSHQSLPTDANDILLYEQAPNIKNNNVYYTKSIEFDGEVLGYLFVFSHLSQVDDFFQRSILTSIIVLLISLIIAMLVAHKFQKALVKPMEGLINTTQKVRLNRDFGIRASEDSQDEFADLAKNFNHMLSEIQQQINRQHQVELEIRQLNFNLEDKVNKRTAALKESNSRLQEALTELQASQGQLVEQETMASLGKLVAGVAHEINTPVGIGVTAISHLNEITLHLFRSFENKSLTAFELSQYLDKAIEAIDVTEKSLNKAAELVKSFKQIAVDQSTDNIRKIILSQHVHDILAALRPKYKHTQHQIIVNADNSEVTVNAGALYQIITNLLINSLLHGFEGLEQGKITISLSLNEDTVELNYSDNGNGISEDNLGKLFEPFYTTKRNEGGTGLGAHIIYNLVTQALHGEIKVSSQVNQGLSYCIRFPANN
ncbi:hypothetical protein C2869_15325 [Saccharobesus litoralis]|uniref:histidine kinase n=1 Tax=Saccharobesus litoralis TaxID=2172099 RepID=A0A2S0VU25_9ALTE|nr:ATP-binding protein [Saccharobesus litoralis]AWB67724.1 hypothetical protein C2869_15325 [Saccharobesus litoralis]